eukprot:6201585-Pleurochrysis_carterae.AAC.2
MGSQVGACAFRQSMRVCVFCAFRQSEDGTHHQEPASEEAAKTTSRVGVPHQCKVAVVARDTQRCAAIAPAVGWGGEVGTKRRHEIADTWRSGIQKVGAALRRRQT